VQVTKYSRPPIFDVNLTVSILELVYYNKKRKNKKEKKEKKWVYQKMENSRLAQTFTRHPCHICDCCMPGIIGRAIIGRGKLLSPPPQCHNKGYYAVDSTNLES
jgi:hypothetical protein